MQVAGQHVIFWGNIPINNPEELQRNRPSSADMKDCRSEQTNCSDEELQEAHPSRQFKLQNNQLPCMRSSHQPTKLKSELCRKFMQFGYCPYEQRCTFAHGPEELKQNQNPNLKYKTKLCFAFFRNGYCRFGERCNYLHRKQEVIATGENQQQERKKRWADILKNYRHLIYESRRMSRLPSCRSSEFE